MARLNHIGIAVADVSAMKKLFSMLGLEIAHSERVYDQGVQTHFIPGSDQIVDSSDEANLELLEPVDPASSMAQFIQKRGPGIHHLSFSVNQGELGPLCDRLRAEGFRLIYDQPRPGAHGMQINFIHPSSAGGVLIEVMEPREARNK